MKIQEINTSVTELKEIAKSITLSLPKLSSNGDIGPLHALSLDLLMGLTELEGKLYQPSNQSSLSLTKETNMSSIDEDQEVKKVRGRLPRWGNNPSQINSRILTNFLKLRKNGPVKVDAFRNAYGNQTEFDKNFPQMKMISERNHGKVFDVTDGIVVIWPKVKEYVEEFSKRVGV